MIVYYRFEYHIVEEPEIMMHSLIQVSSGRNKVLEYNHSSNMSGNWETLEGRITEDGQLEHTLLSN